MRLHHLLTAALAGLFAACATVTPPAPPPAPAKSRALEGKALAAAPGTDVPVEVLLVDERPMPASWPLAVAAPRVVGSPEALAAAGVTPAAPIDFSRWVAVVPQLRGDDAAVPAVLEVTPTSDEVQLWRTEGDAVEVRYTAPCAYCGGAAATQERVQQCVLALRRRVFLVPRPAGRLVLGVVDTRCHPALP